MTAAGRFGRVDVSAQLALARQWAEAGVPTFPIGISWDVKKKATNKRPLCRGGFRAGTVDPAELEQLFDEAATWIRNGPDEVLRVGLWPGKAGVVVVDIDVKNDKDGRVVVDYYDLPPTFEVFTASGGSHRWYRKRDVEAEIGNAFDKVEGVEIRGDAGFVVAPGVVTPWGAWETSDEFPEDVTECPQSLWGDLDRSGARGRSGPYKALTDELRAKLMQPTLDMLDELVEHHGASNPVVFEREGGEPYVQVTRKGKNAGTSASIGYSSPGSFKVFTDGWKPFDKDKVYDLFAVQRHLCEACARNREDASGAMADPSANGDAGVDQPSPLVDPGVFFDKTGLLHADLRRAVLAQGPIRAGLGRSLWRYRDGVWLADGADEVRRRAGRLLGNRRRNSHVEGVVSDLEAEEPFITDDVPDQWVNCRNGLLDWMTGELYPHTPDVPSTYQLTVGWDCEAKCPTVDRWLGGVFPEDAIDLAWEIIGVAIAADTPVHRAVLLLGPGRNGKGTFLRLIMKLIGRQHVSAVTLQQLSEDKFSAAELFGKVANIAGDLDARSIKSTDIFKMATGGDPVPAQRKYGAPFNFFNRATMLFSANELPGTSDLSDGFFSRFVIVPMTRLRLPADGEDKTIEARLHAELGGVLVKAVEGLRRVQINGGFTMSQSVAEATSEYRTKADPVARFLDERMDVTGDRADREPRSTVYDAYRQWCASEEGITHPLSARKFYDRLRTLTRGAVDPDVKSAGLRLVVGAVLVRVDVDDGWGR